MPYQQPQHGPIQGDLSYFRKGGFAYVGGQRAAVNAKYEEIGGGITMVPVRDGLGMQTADAYKAVGLSPMPQRLQGNGCMTWVYSFVASAHTSAHRVFGAGDNNGYYVEELGLSIDQNGSDSFGKFRFVLRDSAGHVTILSNATAIFVAGQRYTICITYVSAISVEVWINGASIFCNYSAFQFNESSIGPMTQATHYSVGNFNYGSDVYSDPTGGNKTLVFARIPIRVSSVTGKSLSYNPWQLFSEIDDLEFLNQSAEVISGSISVTELENDTANVIGKALVSSQLSCIESSNDSSILNGKLLNNGSLAISETGSDTTLIISLPPSISGVISAIESNVDGSSVSGETLILGLLSAVEIVKDSSAVIVHIRINGDLNHTETGHDTAHILPAGLTKIAGDVFAQLVIQNYKLELVTANYKLINNTLKIKTEITS